MEIDRIYNCDCLEGMKHIPDGSVDCIICDLPYEVLNKGNSNAQWDRLIPMEPLWEQYKRIAKPTAAIVLFCQGMFTAQLMMSQPKLWRYNLIWDKIDRTTGFLNANKMPLRVHEDIAVFYSELPTYNPQMTIGNKNHHRGAQSNIANNCYGRFGKCKETFTNEKYPKSIISIDKEHNQDCWHPTQKPVNLIRYLVRTYTNEGDTVLDNCMGSGTTAIACIKEKRHFVGFELNKEYYDKACKRIQAEQSQLKLF